MHRVSDGIGVSVVFCRFVGFDDFLHQRMPDNVFAGEGMEIQSCHAVQFLTCVFQSRFDVFGQVDLAGVAGNDGFRPKPMRVRNIFICSGVVFCASSRMMYAPLSVLPRI